MKRIKGLNIFLCIGKLLFVLLYVFVISGIKKNGMMNMQEKHFMNILVIGNGFDLEQGLPMKYGDFEK